MHFVAEASPREDEEVKVGGVWMVGGVDVMKMSEAPAKGGSQFDSNRFRVLDHDDDSEEDCSLAVWRTRRGTSAGDQLHRRQGQCDEVYVAKVQKPQASAAKIVKAGTVPAWVPKKRTLLSRRSKLVNGCGCKHALEAAFVCLTCKSRTGAGGTITLDSDTSVNVYLD